MLLLNAGDITISQTTLVTICLAVFSMTLGFIGLLHRNITSTMKENKEDMQKSIDIIHTDLQPLKTRMSVMEKEAENIKKDVQEAHKWLNNHDSRIQHLERKIPML